MDIKNKFLNISYTYLGIFFLLLYLLREVKEPLSQNNPYHTFLLFSLIIMTFGIPVLLFFAFKVRKKRLNDTIYNKNLDEKSIEIPRYLPLRSINVLSIIYLVLILLFFVYYPIVKPIYLHYSLNDIEKDHMALEIYAKKAIKIDESFDLTSAMLLTDSLIKTKEGLYEIKSYLDVGSKYPRRFEYTIEKVKFEVDVDTFEIYEPRVTKTNNPFSRIAYSIPYYYFYFPASRYSLGRRMNLKIDKYNYNYFRDKDNIYYIDMENIQEKQIRIKKENNLTTIQDIHEYPGVTEKPIGFGEASVLTSRILLNATPNKLEILNQRYAKSESNVYFLGKILYYYINYTRYSANSETFVVTSAYSGKNENGIWTGSELEKK